MNRHTIYFKLRTLVQTLCRNCLYKPIISIQNVYLDSEQLYENHTFIFLANTRLHNDAIGICQKRYIMQANELAPKFCQYLSRFDCKSVFLRSNCHLILAQKEKRHFKVKRNGIHRISPKYHNSKLKSSSFLINIYHTKGLKLFLIYIPYITHFRLTNT